MPVKKKTAVKIRKKTIKKKTLRKKTDPRDSINAAAIVAALEKHVMGEQEMTATQVSAALALLKKTLPDISDPARKISADPMIEPAQAHEDALAALE